MQIAAAHESLQLIDIATLVIQVASMKRSVNISHQMHQILQGVEPFLWWRVGLQHFSLPVNRRHNALPIGTISLRQITAAVTRKIHVVPARSCRTAVLICPCRYGGKRFSRLQGQQFVHLSPGFRSEL